MHDMLFQGFFSLTFIGYLNAVNNRKEKQLHHIFTSYCTAQSNPGVVRKTMVLTMYVLAVVESASTMTMG